MDSRNPDDIFELVISTGCSGFFLLFLKLTIGTVVRLRAFSTFFISSDERTVLCDSAQNSTRRIYTPSETLPAIISAVLYAGLLTGDSTTPLSSISVKVVSPTTYSATVG